MVGAGHQIYRQRNKMIYLYPRRKVHIKYIIINIQGNKILYLYSRHISTQGNIIVQEHQQVKLISFHEN